MVFHISYISEVMLGAGQLYTVYCYAVQGANDYYVFDAIIHTPNGCG